MKHPPAFLALLCCALSAGNLKAVEPWADAKLPVKDDLELWLDASREGAARQDAGLSPLGPGAGLDFWHDASGNKRHLNQRLRDSRPQLRRAGGSAFLHFDGENDFLAGVAIPRARMTNSSVFVFAAPASNAGGFRGFLAWNEVGRNDYQTGFNIDLGAVPSTNWSRVNIECAGASGERNLLTKEIAFGEFHTIVASAEPGQVRLYLDGTPHGKRSRKVSTLAMDELTIGARHNSPAGTPPFTQSFFSGDIAEVLVYGRELSDSERGQVHDYLAAKYARLSRALNDPTAPVEKSLVTVSNPPPVQMLVPGFEVRQLPLQLNNINNLVYAPDGRLFALGYDGNVFQLKDTDGDGLEDSASYFFKNDRNQIPATIGMAWGPGGLYLPVKGRVIRLRDTGDGTAELETITTDWVPPAKFGGSSLDAVAITVDKQGNVFFGLGCDDWTGAYRINKETGKSDYDIKSERGTILKLSADWKRREIVATGLRWPSSLAFNSEGDLFCTDQEGATWLPNGNPFDELLHIQQGRHYGFPPRHPKYLPDVIDEPSVFDYAPQHESTCGLHFNEYPKSFGPDRWRGDAIVAGESRGKIWRTKLIKTLGGYIAQNQLIACLSMLTIDAVPTPQGELIVTCHSGLPDWGTGPQGKGKLFKITWLNKAAPQPVLAFAASPTETRIVFDRPINPGQLKNLAAQSSIRMGKYVTAGDRFESFRPGYQVVQNQMLEPRFELPILGATVSADLRSVTLQTGSRTMAMNYAVTMPDPSRAEQQARQGNLTQQPAIDLLSDLTGVETTWRGAKEGEWTGWLPHLDLLAARAFASSSEEHARLFEQLEKPGTLTLRAQLDLWQMLRPATQPGSKLDFVYPPENVTLSFSSPAQFDLKTSSTAKLERADEHHIRVTTQSKQDQWLPLEITLKTGRAEPKLEVTWHTADDPRPRVLQLRRILLPWATPTSDESPSTTERKIPEIAGGNWNEGKKIFFSDQAACFKCHAIGGAGGRIGPDLSNLVHRDYTSVMKDIQQPSAAINPDHLAYNIELQDGDVMNGIIVSDDGINVVLGLVDGKTASIAKTRVSNIKPSAISLMPENLLQGLTEQGRKDLLTFLLKPPPAPVLSRK